MIQAMEILQLPLMELQERIEAEMEKNPLLEIEEDSRESEDEGSGEESPSPGDSAAEDTGIMNFEREPDIAVGESPNLQDDFRIADEYAATYADTIDETPARSQNWIEGEEDRRNDLIANIASPEETLQEHLIDQLSWFDLDKELRDMVERLIYNLNPAGFLPGSLSETLGPRTTEKEKSLAKDALKIIHQLEPTGVGAKDIKECLLMQLLPDSPYYEILRLLITHHLEDLEHNRIPAISRKTGYSIADIQDALQKLRKLNPRPSSGFSEQAALPVLPDIVVDKDEDGHFIVRIIEEYIPRLRISNHYRELLKQRGTEKETKEYIRQKVGSAQWLIDSIKQRYSTLRKVADAIVEHQVDFLEKGPHAIRPLKMQQIADKIGVHVTTISRACDDKWMQTPQGIFPLKRFFTTSIQAVDGEEEVARDTVRIKLQQLVDQEDKSKPYSDEELVKLLENAGFKVARRTVVKYRHIMNIPSSRERKNWST